MFSSFQILYKPPVSTQKFKAFYSTLSNSVSSVAHGVPQISCDFGEFTLISAHQFSNRETVISSKPIGPTTRTVINLWTNVFCTGFLAILGEVPTHSRYEYYSITFNIINFTLFLSLEIKFNLF